LAEPTTSASGPIHFGVFQVNLHTGELRKNGSKIRLEGQPFQILALLLERPGELVTREELEQKLWAPGTFVDFEHSINAAVKRLREVLGDSADSPHFIETLPRRGYRFIYPVNGAAAAAATRPPVTWWRERRVVGLLALAVSLVAGLAANVGGLRDRLLGQPLAGAITSIAVLPLENLTGDPDQEYFVDGIHDELVTQMAQIGSLKVISRTSVLRYKHEKRPLPQIARELGVDGIMEGAVWRVGDRIRVSAQLIAVPTDRHLWAQSYVRDPRDVPSLPSEVARAVAMDLKIKLTPQEQARLGSAGPVDSAVFKAYLKGGYYERKLTREGLDQAMGFYRQAIDLDPTYAPSYRGLANCYWWVGLSLHRPPREAFPKARAAALKALELDDTLASAHLTLGHIKFVSDWDWEGAEREFQRAHELDPSWPGDDLSLILTGRFDEGVAVARRTLERDPLSLAANIFLGWSYYFAGRHDESIAQLKKTIELDPTSPHPHYELAWNYVKRVCTRKPLPNAMKPSLLWGRHMPISVVGIAAGCMRLLAAGPRR